MVTCRDGELTDICYAVRVFSFKLRYETLTNKCFRYLSEGMTNLVLGYRSVYRTFEQLDHPWSLA